MERPKTTMGITGILVFVLVVAGCTTNTATSNQVSTPADNENLRIAEIALPGMFCASCAQSSENAFKNMPGVVDASVDIKTKKGEVIYDSSVISKEQLVQEGLIQAYDGKILSDNEYTVRGVIK